MFPFVLRFVFLLVLPFVLPLVFPFLFRFVFPFVCRLVFRSNDSTMRIYHGRAAPESGSKCCHYLHGKKADQPV